MKTTAEIQSYIFEKSSIKTTVKKGTGSMKGYLVITPMFQNGNYPSIPFQLTRDLLPLLSHFQTTENPVFCSTSNICVFNIEDNRTEFKKERKPKHISEMSAKGWGSKNSQMRLDKAAARYAKKRSGPNGDNMVKYW